MEGRAPPRSLRARAWWPKTRHPLVHRAAHRHPGRTPRRRWSAHTELQHHGHDPVGRGEARPGMPAEETGGPDRPAPAPRVAAAPA